MLLFLFNYSYEIKYEKRFKHRIEFIATFRNYLSFIIRQMYNKMSVPYLYTIHKYWNCAPMFITRMIQRHDGYGVIKINKPCNDKVEATFSRL